MKSSLLAFAALLLVAAPAAAGQCEDDIATIDKAIAADDLAPDQRAQLEDMRNQAQKLCQAGNQQEGLDVISEAKAMIGVE